MDGVDLVSYGPDYGRYTQLSVDIGAYADDAPHTIEFRFTESAYGAGDTHIAAFYVDDVSIKPVPSDSD